MKVYLAARYSRLEEMQAVRRDLQESGIEVTSRWVNGNHQAENDDLESMRRFAHDDVSDLEAADLVISFQEVPRKPSTNRGGRHVEFGLSLGLGKKVISVGPYEHVFTSLVDRFDTWEEARLEVLSLALGL